MSKANAERDALIMSNARGMIKLKARSTNAHLYSDLFGTGFGTATRRCVDLGYDPCSNKTEYNEAIDYIAKNYNDD